MANDESKLTYQRDIESQGTGTIHDISQPMMSIHRVSVLIWTLKIDCEEKVTRLKSQKVCILLNILKLNIFKDQRDSQIICSMKKFKQSNGYMG